MRHLLAPAPLKYRNPVSMPIDKTQIHRDGLRSSREATSLPGHRVHHDDRLTAHRGRPNLFFAGLFFLFNAPFIPK
jgi:hypothetical protein